jgi:hypothetical protein
LRFLRTLKTHLGRLMAKIMMLKTRLWRLSLKIMRLKTGLERLLIKFMTPLVHLKRHNPKIWWGYLIGKASEQAFRVWMHGL